jgi:hypothetical protein
LSVNLSYLLPSANEIRKFLEPIRVVGVSSKTHRNDADGSSANWLICKVFIACGTARKCLLIMYSKSRMGVYETAVILAASPTQQCFPFLPPDFV